MEDDSKYLNCALNSMCLKNENLNDFLLKFLSTNDSRNITIIGKITNGDSGSIKDKLCNLVLDPITTQKAGVHFAPWLFEILMFAQEKVGVGENFNKSNHVAMCIALSKLVLINKDIKRFILKFFEKYPEPFWHILPSLEEPTPKRMKECESLFLDVDVMEATFILIQCIGDELCDLWKWSQLFKILANESEEVRWYTCNSIAILSKMSEKDKDVLVTMYVSSQFHYEMMAHQIFNEDLPKRNIETPFEKPTDKANNTEAFPMKYTCRVGNVLLPLHPKCKKELSGSLVLLESTVMNLKSVALGINRSRPILIEGVVGSGKTALVDHLATITGRRRKVPYLTKVQLGDQTDSKTLIGTYRTTSTPGDFIWQPGSFTQCVTDGRWLLLEDINLAPLDVVSLLVPLLESRTLHVPGQGNITAHPDFQLFATRRILSGGSRMTSSPMNIIEKLWSKVTLVTLSSDELKSLICTRWPELEDISEKLVEVYLVLSAGHHGISSKVNIDCQMCLEGSLSALRMSGRLVSVRDLMKWCQRMVKHLNEPDLNMRAFREALDCFCAAVPDFKHRFKFAVHIGSHLNVGEPSVTHYYTADKPEIVSKMKKFCIGDRGILPKKAKIKTVNARTRIFFSKTRLSSCLLEKITIAVANHEPVLIVGETGTGKTSAVQYLAQQTNHTLKVINMNQQSDSSDLLGGFKPVEMRAIVAPIRQEFEELFNETFSVKKNSKFLGHIMICFTNRKWSDLFKLMEHTVINGVKKTNENINSLKDVTNCGLNSKKKKAKGEKSSKDGSEIQAMDVGGRNQQEVLKKWKQLQFDLKAMKEQVVKIQSALAFSFIEGSLVKSIKQGDWVLLDEINLASSETLECISSLLESSSGSITLHERGDRLPIVRHNDFRLFACMNPATDIGKKDLPAGLRNRFTEIFMDEFDKKEDLAQLIHDYLEELNLPGEQINGIMEFYLEICKCSRTILVDGAGHKPHFSLRTLCRALMIARKNPCNNIQRSLHESFSLAFLTQLDRSSYKDVLTVIEKRIFGSKIMKQILNRVIPCPGNPLNFVEVEGYWIPKGIKEPFKDEKYIITETVKQNLKDVVRIVSIGRYPVLLQGDTSVGKTSLINYLANLTGNICVRINNHQHTDLQEYIGSYSPDESGKLVFREGILVQAMKQGHWVILDELNLAPTDVLEALNRLLDDNRELYIPEIETTVRAHEKFMLFATQNPPGLYGGRQVLSRAFRNRFVELHFDLIPTKELENILYLRCDIPLSYAKKMVRVLEELQNRRRDSNIFQGKQSFITLRDLFRWAERYRLSPKQTEKFYDWEQHIADEGFLVLAGRVRFETEAKAIKQVLKKIWKLQREIDEDSLFKLTDSTSLITRGILGQLYAVKDFEHIVWTTDMRRLFVLVYRALTFCEPVLLVGETGCGKTTVCQMISSINDQKLYSVNCHMHTEGADFLGGLRPVRDHSDCNEDRLFEWVDGPLIESMKSGGMFLADEISLADDSVLERLNSVLEPERTLILAEKGSDDFASSTENLVAHETFRLIGTMNPSGDYGKKELSPALRNRFTEIWCPKVEIERASSDVKDIIEHNLRTGLKFDDSINKSGIADAMIVFLKDFARSEIGKKCTLSIRDILSWVSFINNVVERSGIDKGLSYIHGACLVLLDSLGSGATGSIVLNWKEAKLRCLKILCLQVREATTAPPNLLSLIEEKATDLPLINDDNTFGIEPFVISKGNLKPPSNISFSFEAPRTYINLLRLLRGLQLTKPILLEGSPGVGKTSLVTALARASCHGIIRINLSEQTDVSDLFGADLPIEGVGGRFSWCDGPLLKALKEGSWVVFDELNLASQSVLEGLNACFDHRGQIFVPELNKTFSVKHQETKIFACQNPQFQGGARKGLPRSFLNRFTQVFLEPLSSSDLQYILSKSYPQIGSHILVKMVEFNATLVEQIQIDHSWGSLGGPWELNLRDIFRWCDIMLSKQDVNSLNPGEFVSLIYSDRMRTSDDKENVLKVYESIFGEEFPLYRESGKLFVDNCSLQVGHARISRSIEESEGYGVSLLYALHSQMPYLESLINCINMGWMTILVGKGSVGKSSLCEILSSITGSRLRKMAVNAHMDVTELLGGFEQADFGRRIGDICESLQSHVLSEVRRNILKKDINRACNIITQSGNITKARMKKKQQTTSEEAADFIVLCDSILHFIESIINEHSRESLEGMLKEVKTIKMRVMEAGTLSGGGTFEWVDSPLVKAIRDGEWLVINGVNHCSPSVLDRLNCLLEPGGVLSINERGVVGDSIPCITPHKNFRLIFTMDPQYGEISRAMRNRGIEIYMHEIWTKSFDIQSLLMSCGIKPWNLQNALFEIHNSICAALPSYEQPSLSYLIQNASLVNQLIELGSSPFDALQEAGNSVYIRTLIVKERREAAQNALFSSIENYSLCNLSEPDESNCISNILVETDLLQLNSQSAYPKQLFALMRVMMGTNSKFHQMGLPLSSLLKMPLFKYGPAAAVSICISSLFVDHLPLFNSLLNKISINDSFHSLFGIDRDCLTPSETFVQLILLVPQYPLDPRFNNHMISKREDYLILQSLSNKALMGLKHKVQFGQEKKLETGMIKKWNKKNAKLLTLMEISQAVHQGSIGENDKAIANPAIKYLFPLYLSFNELISQLSNNLTTNLCDESYFDLMDALKWKDKLFSYCKLPVERKAFHLFLPSLIFHWKQVVDKFVKNIPKNWSFVLPELKNFNSIVQNIQTLFTSKMTPLHDLVPELRPHLTVQPFTSEDMALIYLDLMDVSSSLMPSYSNPSVNDFLASVDGSEARQFLMSLFIMLNHDSPLDSDSISELKKNVIQLREGINKNIKKFIEKLSSNSSTIKMWPIYDYFVLRQLNLCRNGDGNFQADIDDCLDVIALASNIPLHCIHARDSSGMMSDVSLYLFSIQNCGNNRPNSWFQYDPEVTSDTIDYEDEVLNDVNWNGEKKVILHGYGCLLTYQLLTGFSKPENEIEEILVGDHEERVKQLDRIRATLFKNWNQLTNSTYTYEKSFKLNIRRFVSKLLFSIADTLNITVNPVESEYESWIFIAERSLDSSAHVLGDEAIELMKSIVLQSMNIREAGYSSKNLSKLGVYAGLLQSWLLSHNDALDPAERKVMMLSYLKTDLAEIDTIDAVYKWLNTLRFSQSHDIVHPHVIHWSERRKSIEDEIETYSQMVSYRPCISIYYKIIQDVSHFVETVFLPSKFLHKSVDPLFASQGEKLTVNIEQCEWALKSCDIFVQQMMSGDNLLYRDLVGPVLHGIVTVCESLRVLMNILKNENLNNFISKDLNSVLHNLLSLPLDRSPSLSSNSISKMMDNQISVMQLIKENNKNGYFTEISKSITQKSAMYDLYNYAVAQRNFDETSFKLLCSLVENVLKCWREEEAERKRKQEEEESLYKYRAQTLAINETEEEEIEREFGEMFPTYEEELENLVHSIQQEYSDDDEEGNEEKNEEKDEMQQLRLTDEHLREIIQIHSILVVSLLDDSAHLQSAKSLTMKIVPSVLLRSHQVQLLMRSIGPSVSHCVDQSALGTLILTNYAACASINQPLNLSFVSKPFNFYLDSCPQEAIKLKRLLENLFNRVSEIRKELEDVPHEILVFIQTIISRVMKFQMACPLVKFVQSLEMILRKSMEWQDNAHRGVSLMEQLEEIIQQIIEWRRIELGGWKKCLNVVTHKVSSEAQKWWPHLYDVFSSIATDNIVELIKPIEEFMEKSVLGDYEARLQYLYAFNCHIGLQIKYEIDSDNRERLNILSSITWNVYKYYGQFLSFIREQIEKCKKPIEKAVMDFVKISRWNDLKFFVRKESIFENRLKSELNKSQRTLHKHMRAWEKALRQQVCTFLDEAKVDFTDVEINGVWDGEVVGKEPVILDGTLEFKNRITADVDESCKPDLIKMTRLAKSAVENFSYEESIDSLEELSSNIITTLQELTTASTKANSFEEKDERVKHQKAVIHRKRERLAALFFTLKSLGLSHTRGNAEWKDDDLDKCLTVSPLDFSASNRKKRNLESLQQMWPSCDKYFYKTIARHTLLLKSLNCAHEDIGPNMIKNLKGISCHLLLILRGLRCGIGDFNQNIFELDTMFEEINTSKDGSIPFLDSFSKFWKKINDHSVSLSLSVSELEGLLESFTESESLLKIVVEPSTGELNTLKVNEAKKILSDISSQLNDTILKYMSDKDSYNKYDSLHLGSLKNIRELKEACKRISVISFKVNEVCNALDFNSTSNISLTKSLRSWLYSWQQLDDEMCLLFNEIDIEKTTVENKAESRHFDKCIKYINTAIRCLNKRYRNENSCDTSCIIMKKIVISLTEDINILNLGEIAASLKGIIYEVEKDGMCHLLTELHNMSPLFKTYQILYHNLLIRMTQSFRSLSKLHSILLAVFNQLSTKGFCRPQDLEGEKGDGKATSFEDSGPGLTEGSGAKDVSDRFESEDQLESALQQGESEDPANNDVNEEDGGVEMSDDFEGKQQDIQKEDKGEDDETDDENEEEHDKQMGETEKWADKADKQTMSDEEDEMNEGENKDDEDGPGDGEENESEMVANTDNKSKEQREKEEKEKQKKKELDVMEEDRREPNEKEDEEEESYDDGFKDKFGGEDETKDNKNDDKLDLPDEMNLDQNEKEDVSDNESETGSLNPEIEVQKLFPEDEENENQKGEDENNDGEDENKDENKENNQDGNVSGEDDDMDGVKDPVRMGEEEGDGDEENEKFEEEKMLPSNTDSSKREAPSAKMDSTEASKDHTKDHQETESGAQLQSLEEDRQEEQGEVGQAADDIAGVGQSDSKTKQEAHQGKSTMLTHDEESKQETEEHRARKPGDVDEKRILGTIEKEIQKGILTMQATEKEKEVKEVENKNKEEDEPVEEDKTPESSANLYEHVQSASDHFDKQTHDAASFEQARRQPAPLEDDENLKESEDIPNNMDQNEEIEDKKNVESTKKRENEASNDGPKLKKMRQEDSVKNGDKHKIDIEGDIVMEHTVERPKENVSHTLIDEEDDIEALLFHEDVEGTVNEIAIAGEGDAPLGVQQWSSLEGSISPLALQLCEQLRLILEPTEAAKLRGDYRTGKRLNMRKVIPYIASHFRKDKIWLRRSQPSKRSYQVLLAVDDSQSMQEVEAGQLARQSVALVAKALTLLESGQIGILSFGKKTQVLHPMNQPFSDQSGARVLANLNFNQSETNFHRMLEDASALMSMARGGGGAKEQIAQLLLIISDGQTHARSSAVKAAVRAARNARIFIVFLVIDAKDRNYTFYDTLVWDGDAKAPPRPIVETFPFPFFLVVRDLVALPDALATALRQWFELVTSQADM